MEPIELTIALERYDRHFPFFDGTVKPPKGVTLTALQVGQSSPARDGKNRHGRMLDGEFDITEFSMSTYLMAIDRNLPITAIPVFPRRLFSMGLIYVRADSSLKTPAELKGKRVAIRSFQTTLSLLAKGDLKFEYGVPWEDIHRPHRRAHIGSDGEGACARGGLRLQGRDVRAGTDAARPVRRCGPGRRGRDDGDAAACGRCEGAGRRGGIPGPEGPDQGAGTHTRY